MLADAATNTLWTCQLTPVGDTRPVKRHTALRGFDLATGADDAASSALREQLRARLYGTIRKRARTPRCSVRCHSALFRSATACRPSDREGEATIPVFTR